VPKSAGFNTTQITPVMIQHMVMPQNLVMTSPATATKGH